MFRRDERRPSARSCDCVFGALLSDCVLPGYSDPPIALFDLSGVGTDCADPQGCGVHAPERVDMENARANRRGCGVRAAAESSAVRAEQSASSMESEWEPLE